MGDNDDVHIDDVVHRSLAGQNTNLERVLGPERLHVASAKESPQLGRRPDRLTRATTGAVVTGTMPSSRRARWSAHRSRSDRSAATSAPAS